MTESTGGNGISHRKTVSQTGGYEEKGSGVKVFVFSTSPRDAIHRIALSKTTLKRIEAKSMHKTDPEPCESHQEKK